MDNIQELMELLQCTEEQAKQVIESDKQVDKMSVRECESDLTQEQKASAKKARQGDRKPTVYKFDTRAKKSDLDKAHLIHLLADCLGMVTKSEEDLVVTNAERQIDFVYNGRKFRVVLSAPRN
jgi:hypothetical protein